MNLLVIRLSAMGDTALVVPVLNTILQQYPDLRITMLTRPAFVPMFEEIERVDCVAADIKNRHKGTPGLYRLYKEIKTHRKPDIVIDLHDVIRSWILCAFFKKDGIPYYRIDKGRKEKKALVRKKNKIFIQLKHSVDRYLDVFAAAGYPAKLKDDIFRFSSAEYPQAFVEQHQLSPKDKRWIGIAPFAKHQEKMWPLEKMKQVIQSCTEKGYQIFLFGGGKEEIVAFKTLKQDFPDAIIVAGELSLTKELGLIKNLNLMVTMDSANMHMAAISGIPVVSIWGATHPYAGFGPLNGNEKYIVQISHEELDCRPCSVFGNKPCFRGDHACMEWITAQQVMNMIEVALKT